MKRSYAWTLLQQGRFEDAKVEMKEAKETMDMLENRLKHTSIRANLMAPLNVEVGKEFNARLDIVNAAKNPGALIKVEGLFPTDFKVTSVQPFFDLQDGFIEMNRKLISPFQAEAIKFTLHPTQTGNFYLNPNVTYTDDIGETKTYTLKPVKITVRSAQLTYEVLPGRITTGYAELDELLLGGIPEKYAVALTSPSTDEKELLVKRFLKTGAEKGETTLCITAEPGHTKALAEKYPSNFFLFACNPQADVIIQNLPNVFKLKDVENLTDIDIALTKAFRTLNPSTTGPARICIEIVSDALLQHHAMITRKWLSALMPTLKSKGFTILAVVDPQMHPTEELQAVLSLFDGEIRVSEKETSKGVEKVLKIRKLYNQKYLENEIVLAKERLSE